jgi:hypothetical protein
VGRHNIIKLSYFLLVIKRRSWPSIQYWIKKKVIIGGKQQETQRRILTWKPEGNKLFGRSLLRWKYNIKMSIKQAGCEHVDWMKLAQVRVYWWALMSTVVNLQVAWKTGKFLSSRATVSFSKITLLCWISYKTKQNNFCGLSPQAKYTDRATAACRRS